jgi:hypothetical protein
LLAADEIVMSAPVLGPLEPQVEGLPAVSLLRVIEQKPIAEIDDETLVLADVAKGACPARADGNAALTDRRARRALRNS